MYFSEKLNSVYSETKSYLLLKSVLFGLVLRKESTEVWFWSPESGPVGLGQVILIRLQEKYNLTTILWHICKHVPRIIFDFEADQKL